MTTPLHLHALERARAALADPNTAGADVTIAERSQPPDSQPTALLASFTGDHLLIYPLWPGVNRVGGKPPLSDYEKPPKHWLESRQWLLLIHGTTALVVDDRTTNQSCVIPSDLPRIESVADRRFERVARMPSELFGAPGTIQLDWHGTVSATLSNGSVLVSAYAGFVFGWLQDTA